MGRPYGEFPSLPTSSPPPAPLSSEDPLPPGLSSMFSLVSTARSAIIHIRLPRRRIRRLTLSSKGSPFFPPPLFPLQQVASHFKVVKHAAQKRSCHASQSLTHHRHSSDVPSSPSGRNFPLLVDARSFSSSSGAWPAPPPPTSALLHLSSEMDLKTLLPLCQYDHSVFFFPSPDR